MGGMEPLSAYFKANRGKQKELAEKLGLYPSTISQWKAVPPEYVPEVSAFTGIPREELVPDAFREARDGFAQESVGQP